MTEAALSILVHGPAKVGKTTFAATTPPSPRLLFDVEAASRFLKGRKKYWDPRSEAPPEDDGTWDICVVQVQDFDIVLKGYEWLKSGKHPFKSVIVDSISELQAKVQESVAGRAQMKTQDWGQLLSKLAFFCRDLRDLTTNPVNPVQAVVVTAMSRVIDGVTKPHLQGQISQQISYWFDITSYLWVDQVQDPNTGEWTMVRRLLTDKNPQYEAGNRVPGLDVIIDHPNITQMINDVFGLAPEEETTK